jgi:hypothetical protein
VCSKRGAASIHQSRRSSASRWQTRQNAVLIIMDRQSVPRNAHGNGYADPNILVPSAIESVQMDGGSFNVREGNHSENLAATYGLHSEIAPFVTHTGDYRDVDLVAGWSPARGAHSLVTMQASYGNGFLDRLEHRQQYKVNACRVFHVGRHDLTLFAVGYYGFSYVLGLTPIRAPNLQDTIDRRQKDQTHTGWIAANDVWHLTPKQEFLVSGFFRNYNLRCIPISAMG